MQSNNLGAAVFDTWGMVQNNWSPKHGMLTRLKVKLCGNGLSVMSPERVRDFR